MQEDEKLMTVQEAAAYLKVTRAKVSTLIRDKVLEVVTNPLDKRVRLVKVRDLDRLLAFPRGKSESKKKEKGEGTE